MTQADATVTGPTRAEIEALQGAVLLEFGANWCGHCQAARSLIDQWLASQSGVLRHVRIEDGKGKRLGRQYAVKLWPTLIFLQDGVEQARIVRPVSLDDIAAAFAVR